MVTEGIGFSQGAYVPGDDVDQVANPDRSKAERLVVVFDEKAEAQAFLLPADELDQFADGFVVVFVVHRDGFSGLLRLVGEIQAGFDTA